MVTNESDANIQSLELNLLAWHCKEKCFKCIRIMDNCDSSMGENGDNNRSKYLRLAMKKM